LEPAVLAEARTKTARRPDLAVDPKTHPAYFKADQLWRPKKIGRQLSPPLLASTRFAQVKPISADVVIVGALLNFDIVMAEALTYNGFDCVVVRDAVTGRPDVAKFPCPLNNFSLDRVIVAKNSFEFLRIFRAAKCIISFSGVVTSLLRYFWLAGQILGLPPIINIPTGADITELALERSRAGWLYRSLLRRCAFTVIPAYPHALKVLVQLRLKRYVFFKFPFLLPETTEAVGDISGRQEKIVFLHASNLDWGETDNKRGRNSTKGNDRFLRAFASAARAGAPIECVILDRGPDRLIARKLVAGLDAVRWRDPVPASELSKLLNSVDVVVDQFDVGGFGGIAMEAMAVGKPVMIYLDRACMKLLYDDDPPILNCSSEEQILHAILDNLDRKALCDLGERARRWVHRNHSKEHMDDFILRMCVVAGMKWPPRR
jgi:glycosyltransferase involved in cell wall biosynthesis